jgi:hypothetical protein
MERLAIDVMLECSISGACAILRLSWDEADGIKQRAVKRGLARKTPEVMERLVHRFGRGGSRLQNRHWRTLQTIGHVLVKTWGRECPGPALHPDQPKTWRVLETSPQSTHQSQWLPCSFRITKNFVRHPLKKLKNLRLDLPDNPPQNQKHSEAAPSPGEEGRGESKNWLSSFISIPKRNPQKKKDKTTVPLKIRALQ